MSIPKPAQEDTEYWEQVLHDHALGMHRGRRAWLSYGHEDREKDAGVPEDYSEESLP